MWLIFRKFKLLTNKETLLSLCLLLSIGCKSNTRNNLVTDQKIQPGQSTEKSNEFIKMTIATGGGFTGLWNGYSLYPDGKIERWQRFPAKADSILQTVHTDNSKVTEFSQNLLQSGMIGKTYQNPGNMTTVITFTLPDTTYSWSWSGTGATEDLPVELKNWYKVVQQFCQDHLR